MAAVSDRGPTVTAPPVPTAPGLGPQHGPDPGGPAVRVGAVAVEQGQGDPVHAEAEAGRVGHRPSAVSMPKGREKWSRWQLDDEMAVGRPASKTGATNSYFSSSARWLAASIRPGRPKNGSLATTDSTSSPRPASTSSPRSIHTSRWAPAPSGVPR